MSGALPGGTWRGYPHARCFGTVLLALAMQRRPGARAGCAELRAEGGGNSARDLGKGDDGKEKRPFPSGSGV